MLKFQRNHGMENLPNLHKSNMAAKIQYFAIYSLIYLTSKSHIDKILYYRGQQYNSKIKLYLNYFGKLTHLHKFNMATNMAARIKCSVIFSLIYP